MRTASCVMLLLAVFAFARPGAAAEIVVIESTVSEVEAGAILEDTDTVSIPAGKMIVVVEEDGSSRTIDGPFEGALGSTGAAESAGLVANLGKLVRDREESRQVLGAIRAAPGQVPPEVFLVDVARSGTNCVPAGKPVRFWRPATMAMESELIVEALGVSESTRLLWPANSQLAEWPAGVTLSDGTAYRMRLAEASRSFELTLRVIPAEIEQALEQAAWMIDAGCRRQARMVLAELADRTE